MVDIAEKRFRKMKNRVASFKTSQQQYEIEMKKRDKIEKQMQARIQGLTKELETEREKTEDALSEEMQRVDDEIRRRNEEWNAQNETQRRDQEALLSRKIFCSLRSSSLSLTQERNHTYTTRSGRRETKMRDCGKEIYESFVCDC